MLRFPPHILLAALLVCGCASSPQSIVAAPIAVERYLPWTCEALRDEQHRVVTTANEAARIQGQDSGRDSAALTLGWLIFPPALMAIRGNSQAAAELVRVRGEDAAIREAYRQKGC